MFGHGRWGGGAACFDAVAESIIRVASSAVDSGDAHSRHVLCRLTQDASLAQQIPCRCPIYILRVFSYRPRIAGKMRQSVVSVVRVFPFSLLNRRSFSGLVHIARTELTRKTPPCYSKLVMHTVQRTSHPPTF